jgi:DNA polymerase-1
VAATGRLSSSDPNLQNIPIRTEIGRRIRDAFIPREGWSLLSADYSQIELRVLAHLSHDPELVEAFRGIGDDVHVRTAAAIFEIPESEVTRDQRGAAKTVNYAVIYGQSDFALGRNLKIEKKEARRYIEAFFARYAGVEKYMDEIIDEARRTGGTRTILGRRRMLPDLRSKNFRLRSAAERVARNTPIQGSAADVMKIAMVRIQKQLEDESFESRMLLTVHDELVFEAPDAEKERLEKLVVDHMQNAMELEVPLVVDHGWGPTWGKAH